MGEANFQANKTFKQPPWRGPPGEKGGQLPIASSTLQAMGVRHPGGRPSKPAKLCCLDPHTTTLTNHLGQGLSQTPAELLSTPDPKKLWERVRAFCFKLLKV